MEIIQDFPSDILELYSYVSAYAEQKHLENTQKAMPFLRKTMACAADHPDSRFRKTSTHHTYFRHSLSVCHILIDLQLPLNRSEEDILLAACICHILPENIRIPDLQAVLTGEYKLDPQVCEIVQLLFRDDSAMLPKDTETYFQRIPQNRLAVLMKLADRGNLVQQLYGISNREAWNYIQETRTYFFPMCIYAKEHYPELIAPVSVLMEKMRCLIEVAQILLTRYEARETELELEAEALLEDNAMLKGMIRELQSSKK